MIISEETAKLIMDDEDYVHINGFGKIHIRNFPIETDDYLCREQKPELTYRAQHSLVVLIELQNRLHSIIAEQDNKKLSSKVCAIDNLIRNTLETFKD